MTERTKYTAAAGMFVVGGALIAWNFRDPNRGLYEQPKQQQEVTIDQIPAPVKATVHRESAGGVVQQVQKETKQGKIKYDIDIAKGGQKIGLKVAEDGSILERKTKKLKPKSPSASPAAGAAA
jgi:hypothetical protein